MNNNVKLSSGDSYLVSDSCFTNRIYLIVGERKGALSPKGGAALAELSKSEVAGLIVELQTAYLQMT